MSQCYKEFWIIYDEIIRSVERDLQVGRSERRRIHLDHTLINILLNIHWLLINRGVGLLDLEVEDGLLGLHLALGSFVTDFELRKPDLFLAGSVRLFLSKGINGILDIVVHIQ